MDSPTELIAFHVFLFIFIHWIDLRNDVNDVRFFMRFDKKRNYEKTATTTTAAAAFHNSKCIYFERVYTGIYGKER